ncbi:MAG: ATP-dependent DNA helicase RecQ [Flavobacteriales bacterium]|nr:ATP-dependent DNA helicase RecQ [Flavobacteriales bacterium]
MDIHEVLKKHWGYTSFRPMQEAVIRAVLADKDTLALLPTGGGKSVCYQVPALARGGLCIVVSPLIALMRDQVLQARARGITAKAVMSGMARYEVESTLEEAALGHVSLLYVAPERIASDLFRARLPRMPVTLIAVDEAHCVSQWGYDFRPSYMRIPELREVFPEVPIIALTATATTDVAQDIQARLGFRKRNLFRAAFQRPELTFWVSTGEDKLGRLFRILDALPGSGIVYVRDRRGTLDLARTMVSQGVTAAAYHAGLPHAERERVQNEWLSGKLRYVVATNAFGMGIDKPDVRCVIHMAPPPDLESYYQEAGRAGRDGRPAHAFLLLDEGDPERMLERVRGGFPTMEQVRKTYQAFADAHRIAPWVRRVRGLRVGPTRPGPTSGTGTDHCDERVESLGVGWNHRVVGGDPHPFARPSCLRRTHRTCITRERCQAWTLARNIAPPPRRFVRFTRFDR